MFSSTHKHTHMYSFPGAPGGTVPASPEEMRIAMDYAMRLHILRQNMALQQALVERQLAVLSKHFGPQVCSMFVCSCVCEWVGCVRVCVRVRVPARLLPTHIASSAGTPMQHRAPWSRVVALLRCARSNVRTQINFSGPYSP